ncbi:esterase/lipase family protein [Oceaniferula marina]|nr:alpha/beta fold hydrolase [Oceaniferula marina]
MTKEKQSQRSHSSGTLMDHAVLFQIPQQRSIVSSVLRSGIILLPLFLSLTALFIAPYHTSAHASDDQRAASPQEHVILIHGMARSASCMQSMAEALQKAGYHTTILDYPSRKKTIHALSEQHLSPAVKACQTKGATKIHFVTHSLGGILVRDYLHHHKLAELGKVVMLAPPNQGSEVVDTIGHWKAFALVNGPAGKQLGTADNSPPNALGGVTYPVGIIAGDRSINPINSWMIPGSDDGKVSIKHTKLEGMRDHIVIHCTHPMIMKRSDAIDLSLRFLRHGSFAKAKDTP